MRLCCGLDRVGRARQTPKSETDAEQSRTGRQDEPKLKPGERLIFAASGSLRCPGQQDDNGPNGLNRGYRDLLRNLPFNNAGRGALIGLALVLLLIVLAAFADVIAPFPPNEQYREFTLTPPAWEAGEAVPWPSQQDLRAARDRAAGREPPVQEPPAPRREKQSSRPQPASKKKRRRR